MATRTPTFVSLVNPGSAAVTWTNMPSAVTEFLGLPIYRTKFDLSDFDLCRLVAAVSVGGAAANTALAVQGSTDAAFTSPITLCSVTIGTGTGLMVGTPTTVPGGLKSDVWLRLMGQNGDGVADPAFGSISLQLTQTPTFETCGLGSQIVSNLFGLVRDMRRNATDYKARVTAGQAVNTIAAVMVADANHYLTRLQWVTDLATNNAALISAAVGQFGFTTTQATDLRDTLVTAANHQKNATLTTGAQINTEADWVLANVPAYSWLY